MAPEARKEAVDRLVRAGAVDDERVARGRAELLARRGAGDLLIRHDLDARGIGAEHVEAALDALDPEPVRAERIVAERGRGPANGPLSRPKGLLRERRSRACAKKPLQRVPLRLYDEWATPDIFACTRAVSERFTNPKRPEKQLEHALETTLKEA